MLPDRIAFEVFDELTEKIGKNYLLKVYSICPEFTSGNLPFSDIKVNGIEVIIAGKTFELQEGEGVVISDDGMIKLEDALKGGQTDLSGSKVVYRSKKFPYFAYFELDK